MPPNSLFQCGKSLVFIVFIVTELKEIIRQEAFQNIGGSQVGKSLVLLTKTLSFWVAGSKCSVSAFCKDLSYTRGLAMNGYQGAKEPR